MGMFDEMKGDLMKMVMSIGILLAVVVLFFIWGLFH